MAYEVVGTIRGSMPLSPPLVKSFKTPFNVFRALPVNSAFGITSSSVDIRVTLKTYH